jgi:hypothetical protein
MFTIQSIAYLTMQVILLIPTQVLIMNVPPIMALPARNVLQISCWNTTKWWSNVTLLTITQSICDNTPPILFQKTTTKKPPWKGEKSPSLPTPPIKMLQPPPFFVKLQLYLVILFIQSTLITYPLYPLQPPHPITTPLKRPKKKLRKTSTLCSPLPKFSSIT